MFWTIRESRAVAKEVPKLPRPIRESYEAWKAIVRTHGPRHLRQIKGFHDEALRGEWQGYRSSRLNKQYRVIYRVVDDELLVLVERVTAHDYRR